MAKAHKLPSGRWNVRVFVGRNENGKQIFESFTADSKREAEAMAAEWNLTRKERTTRILTVKQALEEYIETCKMAGMSPATIRGYIGSMNNSYPLLLNRKCSEIASTDVQKQINQRSRVVSPKTIKNEYTLLKTVLKHNVPNLSLDTIRLPKRDQKEVVIPSDQEVMSILDASKKDRDLYLSILFAALLGLRRSEIAGLLWSDFDKESKTISITKAVVRDIDGNNVTKNTKTAAGKRVLPLPGSLVDILIDTPKDSVKIVNLTPANITNRYERLLDKIGLSFRFHDLRHYHASILLSLNTPTLWIAKSMGHRTMDMVNRVYGHIVNERQKYINEEDNKHSDAIVNNAKYW